MPYVLFLLICSIWASSFILMKRAAVCLSPATIGAGRVIFGVAVLALVLIWQGKPLALRKRDWPLLLFVVLLGFVWPYTIQPLLIARHQNSAFIAMTVAFTPLATLMFATFVLGTRPTLRQAVGVGGALLCLLLLMWDGWKQNLPLADLMLAVSVPLSYAYANVWIRRRLMHLSAVELTTWCLGLSGLFVMPFAWVSKAPATAATGSPVSSWVALAILGVFGTGIAMCLFNHLVQQQGPLFAAMVTNLVPLGAMAWGWADAETITLRQLFALLGVLCMVALVQYKSATSTPGEREVTPDLAPEAA